MTLVNAAGEEVPRVMVAVPCGETVHADFAASLALMIGYTTFVRPDMELPLFFAKGTYLPRARAGLVNAALEKGCTHILWLDGDMRFPKDTLVHLLGRKADVIAANYPTRQMPIIPTATDLLHQPVFGGEGVKEVRQAGMGVMLTRCDVFQKIGKPYFAIGYNRANDDYAGEDVFFCEQVRKAGLSVLIDHELSEHVEHCGALRYTMAHARLSLNPGAPDGADEPN